jgi:hypothetical protein
LDATTGRGGSGSAAAVGAGGSEIVGGGTAGSEGEPPLHCRRVDEVIAGDVEDVGLLLVVELLVFGQGAAGSPGH